MAASTYIPATGNALPAQFLVYFLVSSPMEQSANDLGTLRSNWIQVSVYSRSGLVNLPDVAGAMVAAGFIEGPRRELPYDQETRHFGLSLEFVELEEVSHGD
jgi:hypothetical protein